MRQTPVFQLNAQLFYVYGLSTCRRGLSPRLPGVPVQHVGGHFTAPCLPDAAGKKESCFSCSFTPSGSPAVYGARITLRSALSQLAWEMALPQRHPGKRRRSDGRLKPRSGPPRERSLLAMLTRKADGSIFAIPGPGLNHPQLQSLVPKRGNRDVFRDERIRTLQKGAGQIRFGDKNLPVSGKECPDLRVCGRREAPDDDEIHGRVLTGSSCPGPYTCPPAPPPGPFRFPRRAAPAATPAGCRRR